MDRHNLKYVITLNYHLFTSSSKDVHPNDALERYIVDLVFLT